MEVFSVAGHSAIFLYWSGDKLDTVQTMPAAIMCPPAKYYAQFTAGTTALSTVPHVLTGATSGGIIRVVATVIATGTATGSYQGIIFFEKLSGNIQSAENLVSAAATQAVSRSAAISCGSYGLSPKSLYFSIETNDIRFLHDGSTPTNSAATPASQGILAGDGERLIINGSDNVRDFQFINAVSTSNAVVQMVVLY